jgi:TRAP-type C4-dicarboxylate transport system substrate-binding protein
MKTTLTCVLGAVTALGVLGAAPDAAAQEFKLRYAHYLADTPFLQVEKDFAAAVAERSGGRVAIEITYAGGLGAGPELLQLAGRGAVDMAALVPGYFADQLLFWRTFQVPFVFDSPRQALEISFSAIDDLPVLSEELGTYGVKYLFHQPLGDYYFTGKDPNCDTVEGLKGKKLRSFGADIPKLMSGIGAVPVTVPVPEVYEALQRGAIDYSTINRGNILANKFYEVAPHNCGPVFAIAGHIIVIGERTWNRLPADIQQILVEEGRKAGEAYMAAIDAAESDAQAKIEALGGTFKPIPQAELDKWRAMAPDVLQEWVNDMAGKGQGEKAAALAAYLREKTAN